MIQYDLPNKIETYIHRAGRTGRGGADGLATSLLTYHCACAKDLKKLLKLSGAEIPAQLKENMRMFGQTVVETELGDKVILNDSATNKR